MATFAHIAFYVGSVVMLFCTGILSLSVATNDNRNGIWLWSLSHVRYGWALWITTLGFLAIAWWAYIISI